jgi:hypothetical protein
MTRSFTLRRASHQTSVLPAGSGRATPLFGLLADSRGLGVTLAVLAGLPVVSLALAARLREPRPAGAMTTTRGKPVSSAGR